MIEILRNICVRLGANSNTMRNEQPPAHDYRLTGKTRKQQTFLPRALLFCVIFSSSLCVIKIQHTRARDSRFCSSPRLSIRVFDNEINFIANKQIAEKSFGFTDFLLRESTN